MNSRRKYIPDLSEYMSHCEINYAMMNRLIRIHLRASQDAPLEVGEGATFSSASMLEPCTAGFHLMLREQSKYTETYCFKAGLFDKSFVKPVKLTVRLYHDAKLAEVLEDERNHAPQSNHAYPHQVQHYPDDKFQRNLLLKQCLGFCLRQPLKVLTQAQLKLRTSG